MLCEYFVALIAEKFFGTIAVSNDDLCLLSIII